MNVYIYLFLVVFSVSVFFRWRYVVFKTAGSIFFIIFCLYTQCISSKTSFYTAKDFSTHLIYTYCNNNKTFNKLFSVSLSFTFYVTSFSFNTFLKIKLVLDKWMKNKVFISIRKIIYGFSFVRPKTMSNIIFLL